MGLPLLSSPMLKLSVYVGVVPPQINGSSFPLIMIEDVGESVESKEDADEGGRL